MSDKPIKIWMWEKSWLGISASWPSSNNRHFFFSTFLRKKPIFSSNLFNQLKLINLSKVWLQTLAALTFFADSCTFPCSSWPLLAFVQYKKMTDERQDMQDGELRVWHNHSVHSDLFSCIFFFQDYSSKRGRTHKGTFFFFFSCWYYFITLLYSCLALWELLIYP